MAEQTSRWRHLALNTALFVLGLMVAVMLYALGTRIFSPRTDPIREANPAGLVGAIIQVEVRNACGVPGLAKIATEYLRTHGFDVVEVGDHTRFDLAETVVVDRVGDRVAAEKVALALGLPLDRVREDIRLDYYLDASILIGLDYATLALFQDGEN